MLLFHGYSKDIFFHKLLLGLTRLMEATGSKVRTDQRKQLMGSELTITKRSELTTGRGPN